MGIYWLHSAFPKTLFVLGSSSKQSSAGPSNPSCYHMEMDHAASEGWTGLVGSHSSACRGRVFPMDRKGGEAGAEWFGSAVSCTQNSLSPALCCHRWTPKLNQTGDKLYSNKKSFNRKPVIDGVYSNSFNALLTFTKPQVQVASWNIIATHQHMAMLIQSVYVLTHKWGLLG